MGELKGVDQIAGMRFPIEISELTVNRQSSIPNRKFSNRSSNRRRDHAQLLHQFLELFRIERLRA
ncbi:MAG TPA: hypothetical protein VFM21_04420, partial [Terriglobia bacterium]|nr:hypothetical protein [Terriglobia bacterium]